MVSIPSLFRNQQVQQPSFVSKVTGAVTGAPQQFAHWITAKSTVADPTLVQRLVRALGLCAPCPTNGYERAFTVAKRVCIAGVGLAGLGALTYGAGKGLEYVGNAAATSYLPCLERVKKDAKLVCGTDFENIMHHAGSWSKSAGEWMQVVPYQSAKYTAISLHYGLDHATALAKKAMDLFPEPKKTI